MPAADVDGTDNASAELQLLRVDVGGHHCALALDVVVELHAAVQLAPLPDAPEVVAGLVNRRGRPIAVLDLRRRLGLPVRQLRADDHLIVMRLADREMALLVDAAVDVLTVPRSSVDAAVTAASAAMLSQGVAVLSDGLLVVLDVDAFLSADEAAALDEALQQAATASASA